MEVIIIVLLIVLIFKDEIKHKVYKKTKIIEDTSEEKKRKQKEFQEAFDNLMSYSIDKAIESKRGGYKW